MMKYHISDGWLENSEIDILLVGAGGTGSAMLSKLFQMSQLMLMLDMPKLNITVIDPDVVSQPNIGRQAFWQTDLGINKAQVLVSRFNNFGGCAMKALPQAFTSEMLMDESADIIVTCTDSVKVRQDLGLFANEYFWEQSETPMLWLDTGNGSHSAQCVLGTLVQGDSDIILPCVHELYPDLMTMEETNTPSCSTFEAVEKQNFGINDATACQASILLWKLFREKELSRHGAIIDINNGYTSPIEINPLGWQMMGLQTTRPIMELYNKQEKA